MPAFYAGELTKIHADCSVDAGALMLTQSAAARGIDFCCVSCHERRMIRWQWCALRELTHAELYAILAARTQVFVVEQQCPYQDLDGHDLDALHLVGWSGAEVAAYLRVIDPGVRYVERSIGRVITSPAFRRTGLGRAIMARALERLDAEYPAERLRISAQARLEQFYASFGFVADSVPYLEDGMPHLEMLRAPGQQAQVPPQL